jgi:hypothetical protein
MDVRRSQGDQSLISSGSLRDCFLSTLRPVVGRDICLGVRLVDRSGYLHGAPPSHARLGPKFQMRDYIGGHEAAAIRGRFLARTRNLDAPDRSVLEPIDLGRADRESE